MGVGNFARAFAAVNCEISDFHLQAKGDCMKAAQIDSSAGDSFEFGNQAAPHHGLKGVSGRVPCERRENK